jgi:hypothetical protein
MGESRWPMALAVLAAAGGHDTRRLTRREHLEVAGRHGFERKSFHGGDGEEARAPKRSRPGGR